MNIEFSPQDQMFRAEVADFFASEYPQALIAKNLSGANFSKLDIQSSERALAKKGWLAVNWPEQFGGTGWSSTQKYIFDDEMQKAGAPLVMPFGVHYVGPVIYSFGSQAQQQKWLPGILDSTTFWGQCYSEPNSGSDLASLSTSAIRDGDNYVVNGVKIWTSMGHMADWFFALVRTDKEVKPQAGISFICMPANTPGITVYPIIGIDGKHSLNRVEFDNVKVPVEYLIGEEGQGWTYSKYLLSNERTSYARIGLKRASIARLKNLAKEMSDDLLTEPCFSQQLAQVETQTLALEATVLRVLDTVKSGGVPGNESSILKILATENAQAITELYVLAAAYHGLPKFDQGAVDAWAIQMGMPAFSAPGVADYLSTRAESIYGGTNEIQKNVTAKMVLGL